MNLFLIKTILLSVALHIAGSNWPFLGGTKIYAAPAAGRTKRTPAEISKSALQTAQAEFTKGNYDLAIENYKKYLRLNSNDYTIWGRLGAAYYHAGQPRRAQKTLQRIERFSPERSYVYYYQGLCFSLLGMEPTAQKYWEYAGWFPDEYGAKATIELAVSTYKSKEDAKAKFLAGSYLQRFPQGPNKTVATEILKSLQPGQTRLEELKVDERPDLDATIYKYNSWSLFKSPHFWYVKTGFANASVQGYQPGEEGIEPRQTDDIAMLVDASIGLGPVRQKYATAFAGYAYRQRWNMDSDGINAWLEDPVNLELFPLRGDLMERTHQVYGDVRRQFGEQFFMGLYARFDFTRAGSSFFPSPDDSDLRTVVSMTDTQLFIPWIGFSWNAEQRTQFYLYLKKEIHNNSPDHSNKTWDFTGATGDPAFSLGLSHTVDFPVWRISGAAEIFQHEFIFNDYWLDYTRQGGLVNLDYNIWNGLNAFLLFGMYNDNYKLPRIKQVSCSYGGGVNNDNSSESAVASNCTRRDSGTLKQLGLYWNYSANLRFTGSYQIVENSSGMKEYSESVNTIRADVTWAFPGVKRVSRMTERFADPAFAKDAER